MTPPDERFATGTPLQPRPEPPAVASAAQAAAWLHAHGARSWQAADAAALSHACAAVPDSALADWPDVARWRALAALLQEDAEALPCLVQAHAGHQAAGDAAGAVLDAHIALAVCLVEPTAMDGVQAWVVRSQGSVDHSAPGRNTSACWLFWQQSGLAARAVFDPAAGHGAGLALAWLHQRLQPLGPALPPHERLLAASLLVNAHFARQQFEQFDLIAAAVEAPAAFALAPPLMQARWHCTLGYAYYQVGRHDAAQAAWQQGLALARRHGHAHVALMTTLAMLRLLLDRGALDDAAQIEAAIDPRWGAGRPGQLMHLQQMRARLWLLRGRPVQAQATLAEALALGAQAGLGAAELGSCHTDQAQVLLALGQTDPAQVLLARHAAAAAGRDAVVFACLGRLLHAWQCQAHDEAGARAALAEALAQAQAIRYTMFFRLLPDLAAQLCEMALRWDVAAPFAAEVVHSRGLAAPPSAGPEWPWPVWLRLLGGFELRLHGQPVPRPAKPQAKPLELLRLLACQPELALPLRLAADALWPEADGAAALKSLQMTVQRLRRLLGDDTLLTVHEGSVALDPRRVSADVLQRRALLQRLHALAMQPDAGPPGMQGLDAVRGCAGLLRRLVALGAGTRRVLLPGAPDSPWLLACRHDTDRELARALAAAWAVHDRGAMAAAAAAAAAGTPAAAGASGCDSAALRQALLALQGG